MTRSSVTRALRRALAASALTAGLAAGGAAHSAGFAIVEQSASGLGSAYAGAAANPADASVLAYNPAGIAAIRHRQLVAAGHLIRPRTRLQPGATLTIGSTTTPLSNLGGQAGVTAFVPNLYFVTPLGRHLTGGIGLYAPFGLATEYDPRWGGRYHAIRSELRTVSLVPTIALQAGERLRIGASLNINYAEANLTNAVDFSAVCLGIAADPTLSALLGITAADCAAAGLTTPGNPATDGTARVEGDSWGFAFHAGALLRLDDGTRIGLSYRSSIAHTLEGDARFSGTPSLFSSRRLFIDSRAAAPIQFPESVSLSLAVPRGRWTWLADATWTNWSRFEKLVIYYRDSNQAPTEVDESWRSSWRLSAGFDYRASAEWTLRAGLAYDQTPIPDAEHRTPRIPGNDRRWLAVGASYQGRKNLRLDVGYARLFVSDTPIRNSSGQGHLLTGTYESSVDILSAQLVWQMD